MTTINSTRKELIYGVGINDANYTVQPTIDGGRIMCHFYCTWKQMIRRCYSQKFHLKNKTYTGCSVAKEWHSFMSFREWMIRQDWRGNSLDKDILVNGNKIYSEKTCIFVSVRINNLIYKSDKISKYGKGVNFVKGKKNRFCSTITINNKTKNLGTFNTSSEANTAYKIARTDYIRKIAFQQSDYRIAKALLRHAP